MPAATCAAVRRCTCDGRGSAPSLLALLIIRIGAEDQDAPRRADETDRAADAEQGIHGALGEVHRGEHREVAALGERMERSEYGANVLVHVA